MKRALCPYCGDDLTIEEYIPDEHTEDGGFRIQYFGSCESCQKEYSWFGVFSLSSIEQVEEVSES